MPTIIFVFLLKPRVGFLYIPSSFLSFLFFPICSSSPPCKTHQSLYEQINSNLRNVGSSAKVLQMMPEEELSREMQMYRKISRLMEEEKPFTNTAFNRTVLAKMMGTNEKYVADAVREGAGTTVSNYITDIRLKCSLELLSDESGDGEPMSLDDVARDSGFGSYSSFWRAFQKKFSMTPSEYRSLHDKNA